MRSIALVEDSAKRTEPKLARGINTPRRFAPPVRPAACARPPPGQALHTLLAALTHRTTSTPAPPACPDPQSARARPARGVGPALLQATSSASHRSSTRPHPPDRSPASG